MTTKLPAFLLAAILLLTGAWIGAGTPEPTQPAKSYTVLARDLGQLKADFNARKGSVRLVFLVGPTCGICLRGMADLNDEFIARTQNDARLNTFVVHVPTLGAQEKHVAPAIQLLEGPRVFHYWDGHGLSGRKYETVLGIGDYAWDVWMIYEPDAVWADDLPPAPAFWQHQLSGLPRDKYLDKETFRAEAEMRIAALDPDLPGSAGSPSNQAADQPGRPGDLVIPRVEQPVSRAAGAYIRGRGGRENIALMQSVEMTGRIETATGASPLRVMLRRPDLIERSVGAGEATSVLAFEGGRLTRHDEAVGRGLTADLEKSLMSVFDFEGSLVDRRAKNHRFTMNGMVKLGTILAWNLDLTRADGSHWNILVDSHSGAIVRSRLIDDSGHQVLDILRSDFRRVGGVLFAHRVEYRDAASTPVATEIFDRINVARQSTAAD